MNRHEIVDQWAAQIPGEERLNETLKRMARQLLDEQLSEAYEYQAEKLIPYFTEQVAQLHELLLWKHGITPPQLETGEIAAEVAKDERAQIHREMIDHIQVIRKRYETIPSVMPGLTDTGTRGTSTVLASFTEGILAEPPSARTPPKL